MKFQSAQGALEKHSSEEGKPGKERSWNRSGAARSCNICGRKFRSRTKFVRFCDDCRAESEEYQFSDWLSESA